MQREILEERSKQSSYFDQINAYPTNLDVELYIQRNYVSMIVEYN